MGNHLIVDAGFVHLLKAQFTKIVQPLFQVPARDDVAALEWLTSSRSQ